jgi:hypothetical protein
MEICNTIETEMSTDLRKLRKEERLRDKQLRKDRLIQTRVDRRLQKVLMDQAKRRRISVSNLVRNILEDAFGLGEPDAGPAVDPEVTALAAVPALDHVYAWNSVILGRDVECSRCARGLDAGSRALIGLSEDADAPRAWLCAECGEDL